MKAITGLILLFTALTFAVRAEPGQVRRVVPPGTAIQLRGNLSVRYVSDRILCVIGDYNDFLRERFAAECGDFLRRLDTGEIKVPWWSYDFHYDFGALEVIADYQPRIKRKFEDPDNFILAAADGSPVPIEALSYWLNAVSQLRVPVINSGKLRTVKGANIIHYAYLRLAEPLRNGQTYRLTTRSGEALEFVYDDRSNVSIALKVNQEGYLPEAGRKYAYFGFWLGGATGPADFSAWLDREFFLIRENSGDVAFTGRVALRSREQYYVGTPGSKIPLNGEDVYELDFSAFSDPGFYHIYLPGAGRSWGFQIGADAIGKAFYIHARGLFHQRSGIAKGPPYTNWIMGASHMESWVGGFSPDADDYRLARSDGYGYLDEKGRGVTLNHFTVVRETATEEKLPDVHGGWWDAGDFDRRPYHFRIVGDLLAAYMMFPDNFTDGQLDIPESGNGIPDIVDEAVWGVDVWRRAQNPQGGVGCWLEADSHPIEHNPSLDRQRYYLALPTRNSTMEYAAYAAQLARVLADCGDRERSRLFTDSAVRAFAYAADPANRIVFRWPHVVNNRGGTVEYTYNEPPDLNPAFVFKAALNLFLLTGNEEYEKWLDRDRFNEVMRRIHYPLNPFFLVEIMLETRKFRQYSTEYRNAVRTQAEYWLKCQEELAYRNLNFPMHHPHFRTIAWGNAIPFNKGRYFIAAYRCGGNYKFRDAALLLNDWMCGANPMGRSMTTGIGQTAPAFLLSLPSYSDGLIEPIPGLTPYTFNFNVHYNALNMVYGLRYPARRDHRFKGLDIDMMPSALSKGKNLSREMAGKIMDECFPVWRRFTNIEAYTVELSEFSVWETIGVSAAVTGCLLPEKWMPPPEWKQRQPADSLDRLGGYLFTP